MINRRTAISLSSIVPLSLMGLQRSSAAQSLTGISVYDATRWIEAYGCAWVQKDAAAAVELFTSDAVYAAIPGVADQTYVGSQAIHDYWASVTAGQSNITVRHGVPIVSGSKAMVELWVTMAIPALNPDGDHMVTLLETNVLHFASSRKVKRNDEYWNLLIGYVEPPPYWGAASIP